MTLPWQHAERAACRFLIGAGFTDAHLTTGGADGGLDVVGTNVAAQVKWLDSAVGSPDIQRLRGAAFGVSVAAFFAREYTRSAVRAASETGVALFEFDRVFIISPANDAARSFGSADVLLRRANADFAETLKRGEVALRVFLVLNETRPPEDRPDLTKIRKAMEIGQDVYGTLKQGGVSQANIGQFQEILVSIRDIVQDFELEVVRWGDKDVFEVFKREAASCS